MSDIINLVLFWSEKENGWLLKNRPLDVKIHFVGGNPKIETDKIFGMYAIQDDTWDDTSGAHD